MNILFVNYINRSGSTLLLTEFSKVGKVVCLPESEILTKLLLTKPSTILNSQSKIVKWLDNALANDKKLILFKSDCKFVDFFETKDSRISALELFYLFTRYVALKENPKCRWIVYKNTHLGFLFPNLLKANTHYNKVKIVSLVRDPRAIFESQKRTIGSWGIPMSSSSVLFALAWNNHMHTVNNLASEYKSYHYKIQYEQFVNNPRNTIGELLKWLGVNNSLKSQKPNNYQSKISMHLKHIHHGILENIDVNRIDIWQKKLSDQAVFNIESICKRSLQIYDYKIVYGEQKPIALSLYLCFIYVPIWAKYKINSCQNIVIPPNPGDEIK